MGCVLKWLAGNQRGEFDLLFDLMCEPETELRVRDLATLSAVLEAIDPSNVERGVRS
jgi:hypothetical protein